MRGDGDQGAGQVSLTIAVATYKRPELLAALVPELVAQAQSVNLLGVHADVLVVDNDPAASAGPVVDEMIPRIPDGLLRYAHEVEPGITAARNRALADCADSDFLVFIDDDERPGVDWLCLLVQTQREHGCQGVLGPVLAEYQGEPDPWILAGGFFVRPRQATGSTRDVGFTGNLLLDLHAVRGLGLTFDAEFGLTGGEDNLFTSQMTRAGATIVWCDEAVVYDLIPVDRMTRRWVLTRRFRAGTSHSRVALRLEGSPWGRLGRRLVLASGGAVRVVGGSLRYLVGVISASDRHQARGLRTASRGAGVMAGAVGHIHREYQRPTPLTQAPGAGALQGWSEVS